MQRYNKRTLRDMTILGGWLFADLLVALMVICLAAQPAVPKPLPKTPTPSPSPSPTFTMTPTPTPVPRLDFNFHRFELDNVDYNGILANKPSAVKAVEQFINGQSTLHNRISGLVIVYDGAPTDGDIQDALNIAQAVINNVLKVMGKTESLLRNTSYYNTLYLLGASHSLVAFDIYLFKQ